MNTPEKARGSGILTVNKIGGKNMSQLDQVKRLVDVLDSRGEEIVLVVSAFEGVTNKLKDAMDKRLSGTDYSESSIDEAFNAVTKSHEEIIERFFSPLFIERAKSTYTSAFQILKAALLTHKAVSNVLLPVAGSFGIRDQVIGFGENVAAALLNIYLEQGGKESQHIAGVTADNETLEQGPITDRSLHEAKKKGIVHAMKQVEETRGGVTRILGGHVAGTPNGLDVHQGRGYSDIMAVDTSLALKDSGHNVAATRFWKDVDGVFTANPKDLEEGKHTPVLHRDISNAEALENASAGSGIVNVNALALAAKHGLDLQIRNIQKLNPDFGTNITTGAIETKFLFKTIVSNPNVDALTITLPEMADKDGFGAAIITRFAAHEVNIDQIGTEGTSITFTIPLPQDEADREAYRDRIRDVMSDLKVIEVKGERFTVPDIEWDKERFATVSVIGKELQNRRGILGSISSTLGAFGINVCTVSHSKKQTRITYLIDWKDRIKAVQLLHAVYVDNDAEVKRERINRLEALEAEITGTFNDKPAKDRGGA